MAQYFSVHRNYDEDLFDNMFKAYKDKIIIPEQSKKADVHFYIQDTGVYLFVDDMRNSNDIINQKLDEVANMDLFYKGYEIELCVDCESGNTWNAYRPL